MGYKKSTGEPEQKKELLKKIKEITAHRTHLDSSVSMIEGQLLADRLIEVRGDGMALVDDWDCLKSMRQDREFGKRIHVLPLENTIKGGKYSVEFEIMENDPAEYVMLLLLQTREIFFGDPVERDAKVLESARLLYRETRLVNILKGVFPRYGSLLDETPEKERCCPQRHQGLDKYRRFVYIDSLGMVDATKLIHLMELERTFIDKFPTHESLLNSILIKVPLFQNW
ncbi:peptidase C13, legumain [Artemisia annua]|uniref:Peptidase C13, legumain n=1 Tax=Artemisia annua TaxID=35608 RepID=A0A2U1QKP3_ARTAN|nr:peptidase C13, legumain [Artemisia annua]